MNNDVMSIVMACMPAGSGMHAGRKWHACRQEVTCTCSRLLLFTYNFMAMCCVDGETRQNNVHTSDQTV